jgi:hypothetical protein
LLLEIPQRVTKTFGSNENALSKRHQWLQLEFGHVFQAIQITSQPQDPTQNAPRDWIGLIFAQTETSWIRKTTESGWCLKLNVYAWQFGHDRTAGEKRRTVQLLHAVASFVE